MRVIKGLGDPAQVRDRRGALHRSALDAGGKAAAGYVLDDHVRGSLVLTEVEDVEHVGVAQLGDGLGFTPKASRRVQVQAYPVQHLDRAGALELGMVGAVDDAHGAFADGVLNDVLPQLGTRPDRHGT